MSALKVEETTKQKKQYVPHQLRSRPFRCITLPMISLTIFVFYWFILVPFTYHIWTLKCDKSCKWTPNWKYIYWGVVSAIFLILLAIALCLWCCKPDPENAEGSKQKLLQEPAKRNNWKNDESLYNLSMESEKKSVSRETIENENFDVANLQNLESKIEKMTVTLPIRKSIIPNEAVEIKEIEVKKEENKEEIIEDTEPKIKSDESMSEEIDKMFPRCSIRRKPESRKRPDTLIIHSPKYPKEDSDLKRHTMSERPKTVSPLTPREIFFFDLIQGANKQTLDRTKKFLENERKHSSNNFTNLRKPEIKDFVLKQRSDTEASSPEYFIANVPPQRNSCTTEMFMYVDGGQPEEALTICYIDQDDDVFKN